MGIHKYSSSYADDEDYIDIELFSSPNIFCYSITSSSPARDFEFEFKMCPFSLHKTSPADELFSKGKLLPLYLPPRSQTLQTLLNFSLPQSCTLQNLSAFPTENSVGNMCFFHPLKKPNWSCKLKQSLLSQKIKASTTYLKSLFTKSGDDFSCTKPSERSTIQPENFDNLRYMKISKNSPFGDGDNGRFKLSNGLKKEMARHQRRHSLTSITSWSSSGSSSSSSSSSSSGSSNSAVSMSSSKDLQLIKRSRSANNAEMDNSIEGAIAYCNKSYNQQKLMCSNEVGVCSLPVSALVTCGDQ